MAAVTWQDVADAMPELNQAPAASFTGVPAAAQLLILSFVNTTGLDVNNYDGEGGKKTFAARMLLAAHYATMLLRRGVGGVISHQSEGGAAQSYLIPWKAIGVLDTTSYGQMLRALTAGTPARAGFLAGGGPAGGWG